MDPYLGFIQLGMGSAETPFSITDILDNYMLVVRQDFFTPGGIFSRGR
jgi:hypothetical protein